MESSRTGASTGRIRQRLVLYASVARPSHWFKNVFMVAGVAASLIYFQVRPDLAHVLHFLLAFWAACCVASANYIVNEILDGPYDAHHPVKRHRPVPSAAVDVRVLMLMVVLLLAMGLGIGMFAFRAPFVMSLAALAVMGVLYNVPPIRTKDLPYVDAISESINNPIRLCIGWFAISEATVWPPLSLLLAYWTIGAFLMTAKRYAEYRAIDDPQRAARYRRSFEHYSESSLLICMIVHISCFMVMYGLLAAKYKAELLLAVPLLVVFIAWFFRLAFEKDEVIQHPEQIVYRPAFMTYCALTFCAMVVLTQLDLGPLVAWMGLKDVGF